MKWAQVNGKLIPEAEASVPLTDTGLLHGAGVFTTMRARGGEVLWLPRHLARLRGSCEALRVPLRAQDAQLAAWVKELLQASALPEARVRLTVTRGAGGDAGEGAGAVFATAAELVPYAAELYETGAAALTVEPFRLNPDSLTAGHKTLNYLERLAALEEARARGAAESLWSDGEGRLQSGCISNVFLLQEGELVTPPTNADLADAAAQARCGCRRSAVLPGITRQVVFELAQSLNMPVRVTALSAEAVPRAAECFLTNSIMGILPVGSLNGAAIGAGAPGPLTRRLMAAYAALLTTSPTS